MHLQAITGLLTEIFPDLHRRGCPQASVKHGMGMQEAGRRSSLMGQVSPDVRLQNFAVLVL